MKKSVILVFLLLGFLTGYNQNPAVPVFESGKDGHKSYRIPAIISLPNGDLLAFAEGRKNNSGDFGDINIK